MYGYTNNKTVKLLNKDDLLQIYGKHKIIIETQAKIYLISSLTITISLIMT